ncbi:MAG: citrate (Si)-synthase [Gammaproteobacteria bacterium]|nr:MAG: citrate (Si)-synthase [Gammaproteobacteria bacterium]
MSEKKVTLTTDYDGTERTVDLDVLTPTLGNSVIDISKLTKKTGLFTHDPGFTATSSCESKITFIDGGKGQLLYRGYPIEQLAKKSKFRDVAYLLIFGELPTEEEAGVYRREMADYTQVNTSLTRFFEGFRYDAHPMAMMSGVVASLAAFYPDALNIADAGMRRKTALRLVAKMPVIAAASYRHNVGGPFVYPDPDLKYTENLLHMMFSQPNRDYPIDELAARALDVLFVLHADHEQNASTSTVRLCGSTGTNPYSAVASGIAALWGAAHGGANEAVLRMLDEIGDVSNIDKYVAKAKDKKDPFRIMGFGHRVYRNFDPRATLIRGLCHEVLEKYGNDPRLELASRLEEIALKDDYFIERKLYPNVDFYSGIIYSALGIPTNMFTAMFAIARTAGWVAHWNEMVSSPYKIGRPRQLYTGYNKRDLP